MEDMMKNSSTKQPPKGSTPPSRMVSTGFKYLIHTVVLALSTVVLSSSICTDIIVRSCI